MIQNRRLDAMLHLNVRSWPAARRWGGAALLLACAGCDGFPAAFTPSGERVHVVVRGPRSVEVDGRTLAWQDFIGGMRRRVVDSEQGQGPRPWVIVEVEPGSDAKLVNRMLDDLQAAGVRSIDLGR